MIVFVCVLLFFVIFLVKIVSDVMIGLLLITSSFNVEAYFLNFFLDIFASVMIE